MNGHLVPEVKNEVEKNGESEKRWSLGEVSISLSSE
jgi:hypothetical protein